MRALFAALIVSTFLAAALSAEAQDARTLRARHEALRAELADNPFGRPLARRIERDLGRAARRDLRRDRAAVQASGDGLRHAAQWCEVLILQANVKNCAASNRAAEALAIFVARKPTDSPGQAYRVDFGYQAQAARADYLHVALDAPEGPLGTTDYRIRLEATPLDASRTFLHLAYSYTPRASARLGMNMYLATSGRDKVGFSIASRAPDGRPVYVGGVRGVVERNTMRYYLALEAYLDTLDASAAGRLEQRLRAFHAGLERYPRQLHELELGDYLDIKRRDTARAYDWL